MDLGGLSRWLMTVEFFVFADVVVPFFSCIVWMCLVRGRVVLYSLNIVSFTI